MNISNSKKQLAKIISENGGWREGAEHSSQDGSDGQVSFYKSGVPIYNKLAKIWNAPGSCVHMYGSRIEGLGRVGVIKNFHQTILSRDEYFHLYPAPDADGWIEYDGNGSPYSHSDLVEAKWSDGDYTCSREFGPGPAWNNSLGTVFLTHHRLYKPVAEVEPLKPERIVTATEPTIEQLAANYRAKLAIAQQAQEEADAANREADAALCKLERAGEAIGLLVSPIKDDLKIEGAPSLNITDWRDLKVGDVVQITSSANPAWREHEGIELTVRAIGPTREHVCFNHWRLGDNTEWRFIRRP